MKRVCGEDLNINELRERALHKYVDKRLHKLEYLKWRRKHIDYIYERDGGICVFCHCKVSKKEATLDHLTPPERSGKKMDLANVAICCDICNNRKGMLTAEEYVNAVMFKS